MPSEATFLAAADAFETAAGEADGAMAPVERALTPDVLDGGLLTDQVRLALDRASALASDAAARFRRAADACRWRAQQCRGYWQDVRTWQQADAAYQRQARSWQTANAAHQTSPSMPGPGAPPRAPGAAPARPYGWID